MAMVAEHGLAPLADAIMGRWFSEGFIETEPETIARMKAMMMATPAAGHIANCEGVRDMDHRDILAHSAS
jgi:3-oxoadipate enol-lactonase